MRNGHRIIPKQHRNGLNFTAPFWQGERAEQIVAQRLTAYDAERVAKRAARSSRPKIRGSSTAAPATLVPKELRRLERALARRKTLAARQRLEQRIAELKRELDT